MPVTRSRLSTPLMTASSTPPRPRVAFRVGVTGHRLVRLLEPDIRLAAVETQVRTVLAEVVRGVGACNEAFGSVYAGTPLLRVVSPLAEGADQMVAQTGLDLGYQLHAVLPCLPGIYASGFQRSPNASLPDPCASLERLLARADAVQILDAHQSASLDTAAYAAVGLAVLRHADILVAIWDQTPADGPGTGAVVEQARDWDIPVVLIDPRAPEQWHLEWDGHRAARDEVVPLVRRILAPPAHDADDNGDKKSKPWWHKKSKRHAAAASPVASGLVQYLDTRPGGFYGGVFSALVALCAFEWPFRNAPVRLGQSCIARARNSWDAIWRKPSPLSASLVDPISRLLRDYFAWADGLAEQFGITHRDASIAPYIFAPLTVIAAVGVQVALSRASVNQMTRAALEVLILGLNLGFYEVAVHGGYHERWIDYRSLAEELRHLAFLWPLGRPFRSVALTGETATEASQFAWVGWYARAVGRQGGLYPCVFTPERLEECRTMLVEHFLRPQYQYHDRTESRFRVVQDRLHTTALWLFRIAFLIAIVDVVFALLLHEAPPSQTQLSNVFSLGVLLAGLAVILPYIATGTHGFSSQGDFWNLARRSQRMCRQLEPLIAEITAAPPTLEALGTFAEDAAEVMRDEVLHWRVFVRLKPPGLG
jgi:hypothetical protein